MLLPSFAIFLRCCVGEAAFALLLLLEQRWWWLVGVPFVESDLLDALGDDCWPLRHGSSSCFGKSAATSEEFKTVGVSGKGPRCGRGARTRLAGGVIIASAATSVGPLNFVRQPAGRPEKERATVR